ncbi:class II fructose-bisphosphatase [Candidatus Woesearchaeota archaeon]|nr:class II fructose-bisphosphatase [Candidatus Woesearchaeota archaeon]
MERNLALEFVRVTEEAAIAAARWVGKGDKNSADQAAVNLMRKRFDTIDIDGQVVIGEGERDEAPMLYIGEKLGNGKGPKFDIAVDPLECTNSVAFGRPNAISVLAAAPKGNLLGAPDIYMNKIAVGPLAKGKADIDATPEENIYAVAEAVGKEVEDVTVVVLDRERHEKLITEIRAAGARIILIPDGDVSGAIAPSLDYSGADLLMGIGAAPEGVLAAAAIRCLGGEMQARFSYKNDEERKRAQSMGIIDPDRKYMTEDLARGDNVVFAATGVLPGLLLEGVQFTATGAVTHSLVMRSKSKTIRFIKAIHRMGHEHKPQQG